MANGKWRPMAAMGCARISAAAATSGGRIYMLGGFDGSMPLRSVECYDPSTDPWHELPSMVRRRVGPAAAAIGGFLYIFGGRHSEHLLGCHERFDMARGSWDPVPAAMGRHRVYVAAVSACL
mmetsp:Transcript_43474/g.139738  ORF Transcript_43474/g.139738 Transcript_43474/m.139738 type:complete len:122 (+) Transcript_43474:883-1248(+)